MIYTLSYYIYSLVSAGEQTARRFKREPDLGLIAIEPNMSKWQCLSSAPLSTIYCSYLLDAWMQWPLREEARLIGLPFAVDEVEGTCVLGWCVALARLAALG